MANRQSGDEETDDRGGRGSARGGGGLGCRSHSESRVWSSRVGGEMLWWMIYMTLDL